MIGKLSKFRTRQLDAAGFDWGVATKTVIAPTGSGLNSKNCVSNAANSELIGQTKSSGSKEIKKKGKEVGNVTTEVSFLTQLTPPNVVFRCRLSHHYPISIVR